jgi:nucleoside 2-deoxyribosyltransferase
MMDYYIAAPFFNRPQVSLVWQMEQIMDLAHVSYYSPRQFGMNKQKGPIDEDRARGIFDSNVGNIIQCRTVIAVLDWNMPDKNTMHVIRNGMTSGYQEDWQRPPGAEGDGPWNTCEIRGAHVAGPLNLPDTGTVWEMGCAWAKGIPVFAYTDRKESEPLNVMLVQCCKGVIYGLNHLRGFVNGIEPAKRYLGVYR